MNGKKNPTHALVQWLRRQPPMVKAIVAIVTTAAAILFLRMVVHDHDNLFVAAEAVHAIGIAVLIYKLTKEKTCAGYILDLSVFPFHLQDAFSCGYPLDSPPLFFWFSV